MDETPFRFRQIDDELEDGEERGPLEAVEEKGKMLLRGRVTSSHRDRQGDCVRAEGMELEEYENNPVVLLNHGAQYPLPIGQARELELRYTPDGESELLAVIELASTDMGKQCWELCKAGLLKGLSAGFRPIEIEPLYADRMLGHSGGKLIRRSELCEISLCAVPINQMAANLICAKAWSGAPLHPILVDSIHEHYAPAGWVEGFVRKSLCLPRASVADHPELEECAHVAYPAFKAWDYTDRLLR